MNIEEPDSRSTMRRTVRISAVSLLWEKEHRTLAHALERLDEAGTDGADLVVLPEDCVPCEGEPISGPISERIAAKAREHRMYVVGNLKERDGSRLYQTSFLCDRNGEIVGKYRKSHRLPDEDLDLGDEIPVFETDFGRIGLKIGTDHYFEEVDAVLALKGAKVLCWSTSPEPLRDEYWQDLALRGRAIDNRVYAVCAQYAASVTGRLGYLTNDYDGRKVGCPIGRAYVVDPRGHGVTDTGYEGGVATATIPVAKLEKAGRDVSDRHREGIFWRLGAPVEVRDRTKYSKRRIRVGIIEAHLDIEALLAKLDEAGQRQVDIVCLYEFVWPTDVTSKGRLRRIAEKAKRYRMYAIIAGQIGSGYNEAILFGRDGEEVGRYHKIHGAGQTDPAIGKDTPVFETDFGTIGIKICADEGSPEIDRCFAVQGAEIIFTPTQSWGPYAELREIRDMRRALDNGVYFVSANRPMSESNHRSFIIDPQGHLVAASEFWRESIVVTEVDLDNKRIWYRRDYEPAEPAGYLPDYQTGQIPKMARNLIEVIVRQRRPDLYGVLTHG